MKRGCVMGLKIPVPEPTETDMMYTQIGFDAWYEHDSEIESNLCDPECWKQSVLSLIRIANHYRMIAEGKKKGGE